MLSALTTAYRPDVLAQVLPARLQTGMIATPTADAPNGDLGPAVTRGTVSSTTALMNYGLPRNVVIARLTNAASAGDAATPSASPLPPGEEAGSDSAQEPAWGLSIASRYVGAYASPGRAASAAYDLVA